MQQNCWLGLPLGQERGLGSRLAQDLEQGRVEGWEWGQGQEPGREPQQDWELELGLKLTLELEWEPGQGMELERGALLGSLRHNENWS